MVCFSVYYESDRTGEAHMFLCSISYDQIHETSIMLATSLFGNVSL